MLPLRQGLVTNMEVLEHLRSRKQLRKETGGKKKKAVPGYNNPYAARDWLEHKVCYCSGAATLLCSSSDTKVWLFLPRLKSTCPAVRPRRKRPRGSAP